MDAVDYKILKGAATQQFGVCSRETLNRLVDQSLNQLSWFKWISVGVGVIGLPLCLIGVGYALLLGAVLMYVFAYAKPTKKLGALREYIATDPELDPPLAPATASAR